MLVASWEGTSWRMRLWTRSLRAGSPLKVLSVGEIVSLRRESMGSWEGRNELAEFFHSHAGRGLGGIRFGRGPWGKCAFHLCQSQVSIA